MNESCAHLIARGHWAEDLTLQRCVFPIGPRNTYSNLAYIGAGGVMASRAAWVMAGALVLLGVGSALYHGTKTLWGKIRQGGHSSLDLQGQTVPA